MLQHKLFVNIFLFYSICKLTKLVDIHVFHNHIKSVYKINVKIFHSSVTANTTFEFELIHYLCFSFWFKFFDF